MPLLVWPIAALFTGGAGFAVGSWTSNGWLKWLFILIIVVIAYITAKKMGFIK